MRTLNNSATCRNWRSGEGSSKLVLPIELLLPMDTAGRSFSSHINIPKPSISQYPQKFGKPYQRRFLENVEGEENLSKLIVAAGVILELP